MRLYNVVNKIENKHANSKQTLILFSDKSFRILTGKKHPQMKSQRLRKI